MAISYPLAFPTARGVSNIKIGYRKVVGESSAPFSKLSRQTYEWPGNEWWELSFDLIVQSRAEAAPWLGWLLSLDAQIGTFLYGDPSGATPLGASSSNQGTPQVDGSGQAGKELAIKTGLGTTASWILAGTWLQLGSNGTTRLYNVVKDASLPADGRVTLDIRPKLRSATVNNETVTLTAPKGIWSLSQGTIEDAIDTVQQHRLATITAVEAMSG